MLGLAALLSAQMALQHAAGIGLPGCGPGSPCARAAASRWGSLPGLGWPVSYLGTAFFCGVVVAWIAGRGAMSGALLALVRLGVAASVFFVVVSIGERLLCAYCLAVHGANFIGWIAAERAAGPGGAPRVRLRRTLASFAVGAALVGVALAVLDVRSRRAAAATAEKNLAVSTEALRGAPGSDAARSFGGRFPLGPDHARVRVVIFTDYQCPDCRLIESQVEALIRARPDVSLSVKHFPFCTECNPRAERNLHPNACWAARAAEAAGALGGPDGFWRVHRWLFDRGGAFTDAELRAALPGLGFDADRFVAEMSSDRTLNVVRADIDEAFGVGLSTTPMIFINGVELKGWTAPDALSRAAEAAASSSSPATDRPPEALTKLVADWLEQPRSVIPPVPHPWVRGTANAHVRVVLFGDYQEPNCAEVDALLRKLAAERPDTSYEFRHFPLDPACNPIATSNLHPMACRMSIAAESAGAAGGEAAFWTAHEWIFGHQRTFTDHGLRAALEPLGVTPQSLANASVGPGIAGRILADCRAAEAVGVTGIPYIFVNDRRVPRWTYEGLPVMEAIVKRAAQGE